MSRKRQTDAERMAEWEAQDKRNAQRETDEREARLDAPVSRRELLEAIEETRKMYSGSGWEARSLIADAFNNLVELLK